MGYGGLVDWGGQRGDPVLTVVLCSAHMLVMVDWRLGKLGCVVA